MADIYIVRHWQNIDNLNGILNWHRDLPLTPLGEKQAEFIADHLLGKQISFSKIFASPLDRALSTAKIIASKFWIEEVGIIPELIERDFWVMTWIEISRVVELCEPHILKTPNVNYFLQADWAETFPDLLTRAWVLLDKLEHSDMSWNILLVCHWDIWKMIYARFYDLDWKDVLSDFYFWNTEAIRLGKDIKPEESHVDLKDVYKEHHT